MPDVLIASATCFVKPGSASCKAETLTEMLSRAASWSVSARSAVHEAAWRHASLRIHTPNGTISPLSSAKPMNFKGEKQPPGGVVPPHQRLHSHQGLGVEVDDGLVVELQLLTLESPVEIV